MEAIRARRTASPVTISNSWPTRARRTRERWWAWDPTRAARRPLTSSAIQRRRVIKQSLSEDIFDFTQQGAILRLVFDSRQLVELLEEFSLPLIQLARGLHLNLDKKVPLTMAIQYRHALVAKSECSAGLGPFGDLQFVLAFQRWHGEFSTQRGLGK